MPLFFLLEPNRRASVVAASGLLFILHNITKKSTIPSNFLSILFGNVENFLILDNVHARFSGVITVLVVCPARVKKSENVVKEFRTIGVLLYVGFRK